MGVMHSMGRDTEELRGATIQPGAWKRVWKFARPYRWMIFGFVTVIVIEALLALVPPLLFKRIIDNAIANHDRVEVNVLAGIIVASALLTGALSFVERWWSSRIGEGLIYDLRVEVFDHVQRMPIAFFTRTQTGALISRMNNDVIGAQQAVTGTLGSVVSNVVMLITTLIAMGWAMSFTTSTSPLATA